MINNEALAVKGQLPDWAIREFARQGMIEPFIDYDAGGDAPGVVSFGLTSFGYDMRLAPVFKVLAQPYRRLLDCKNPDPSMFLSTRGDCAYCDIPPNSFVLGCSLEYFNIPRHISATVLGKSTYARLGLIVNVTPMEPEWKGQLTIELSNTTPLPLRVYANEGIAQVLFFANEEPERSYADKKGKYQNQQGITLATVRH